VSPIAVRVAARPKPISPRITRPTCKPIPMPERLVQIVRELLVELLERERHGRGQTLPARRLGWLIDAEERHDAVAQELVDPAALGLYRLAHRLKY
jgi:hypothetical protein